MMTTKKTANDFFTQLYNSWIRVDDAYLQAQDKKDSESKKSKK